jgi:hypothetical protein
MVRRIERDITPQLDPSDREFKDHINTKKRKFAEAFPDLNSSNESSNSDQIPGTNVGAAQSRKKRMLNQVQELSENVLEYQESIEYLRLNKTDF